MRCSQSLRDEEKHDLFSSFVRERHRILPGFQFRKEVSDGVRVAIPRCN